MKILTNTAISLDGRITTKENQFLHLGSNQDLKRMSLLRSNVDAVLVGGQTFRNGPVPHIPDPKFVPDFDKKIWNVIVSRKMKFDFSDIFLKSDKIFPLFLTDNKEFSEFELPYKICEEKLTPHWIKSQLQKRGIQRLLIEAGGDLIYQFLAANLIDEIYLTLTPKIIGARGAPSLADGKGFSLKEFPEFQLLECEPIEDEVFLHYKR